MRKRPMDVPAYLNHGSLFLHGLLVSDGLRALLQFLRGLQDPVVVLAQAVIEHLVVGHVLLPLGDQVLHTARGTLRCCAPCVCSMWTSMACNQFRMCSQVYNRPASGDIHGMLKLHLLGF